MGVVFAPVEPVLAHAKVAAALRVNEAKTQLLRSGTVVTVEQIAGATARSYDAAQKWVRRKREAGVLVAVDYEGQVLVPAAQFDDGFGLDEFVSQVVSRLLELGLSEWSVWDWLETPNTWLSGDTPVSAAASGRTVAVTRAVEGLMQ